MSPLRLCEIASGKGPSKLDKFLAKRGKGGGGHMCTLREAGRGVAEH